MQDRKRTELIQSFNNQSETVKLRLTALLDTVKEGRVPPKNALAELSASMDQLRAEYDAFYAMAKASIPERDLPGEDCPIGVLAETIENTRLKYVVEQLNKARSVLSRFVSIKSLIENYAQALAP